MSWWEWFQLIFAIILIVSFIGITMVRQSAKKQFLFSFDKEPTDILLPDNLSFSEEKFNFTLSFEIYAVEDSGKELIGYFEEKTNWVLGTFNFIYNLRSVLGFSMELRDLSGKVIQQYKQSFGVFSRPKLEVLDAANKLLMVYQSQSNRSKELKIAGLRLIGINNSSGKQIGHMTADVWERRYKVYDENNQLICQIDKPFKNLPWSKEELVNTTKETLLHDDKFLLKYQNGIEESLKKVAFPAMVYVAVNYHKSDGT